MIGNSHLDSEPHAQNKRSAWRSLADAVRSWLRRPRTLVVNPTQEEIRAIAADAVRERGTADHLAKYAAALDLETRKQIKESWKQTVAVRKAQQPGHRKP